MPSPIADFRTATAKVPAYERAFFLGSGRSPAHFRALCPLRVGELAGDVVDRKLKNASDLRCGLSRHVHRRARQRTTKGRLRNAGLFCHPTEFQAIGLHVRTDNRCIEFHEVA
jgi:hypothetical protein